GERAGVALLPVERRLPAAGARGGPAVREPERGLFVAAVGDELHHLAARREPVRDPAAREVDLVARALVVERERSSLVPDLAHALAVLDPAERPRVAAARRL